MRRGANWSWEDLGRNQKGNAVRPKLVEVGAEIVQSLKAVDVFRLLEIIVGEGRDNKRDKAQHESDDLHPLAAVELVVDEPCCGVVACQLDPNIDQVPEPVRHKRLGGGVDNLDKFALEELVAVEEDIVCKPASSGGEHAWGEILEGQGERLRVLFH